MLFDAHGGYGSTRLDRSPLRVRTRHREAVCLGYTPWLVAATVIVIVVVIVVDVDVVNAVATLS